MPLEENVISKIATDKMLVKIENVDRMPIKIEKI